MSITNKRHLSALLLVLSMVGLGTAHAVDTRDDTEIYFQGGSGLSGDPQVFFYIEYTSTLASVICTGGPGGVTATSLNTATKDTSSCPQIWPLRTYLAANDLDDSKIDQFELTRAALKRVLAGLGGLKVGLLMAHNDAKLAPCKGNPAETAKCSQGAYIFQGLQSIVNPAAGFNAATATPAQLQAELDRTGNEVKKRMFQRLDALPTPQGHAQHAHQNKEVYFELFRYLTGQAVFNGHNGWDDYATGGDYNLGSRVWTTWSNSMKNLTGYYTCDIHPIWCRTNTTWNSGIDTGTSQWITASSVTFDNLSTTNDDIAYDLDVVTLDNGKYMWTGPLKWDSSSTTESGSNYVSPLADCSKVFVINVVDGKGNAQDDADTAIKQPLSSGGMGFPVSPGDTGFKEVVQWMHDQDLADGTFGNAGNKLDYQTVTSFFVANHPSQVDAAAIAGGTAFAIQLGTDADAVVNALNKILSQVYSVSTTYVAASIPVNVFNRSSVIDNAYLALFQANKDSQPNWVGNLKKLKLKTVKVCARFDAILNKCVEEQTTLTLVDSLLAPAIDVGDGRILKDALTFWTQANGYDLTNPAATADETSGRDGRSVHRGGAGQKIPLLINTDGTQGVMNWDNSTAGRKLYTEANHDTTLDPGSLIDLSWNNIASLWPSLYNNYFINEDINSNGVLDAGEDRNGNGLLETGALYNVDNYWDIPFNADGSKAVLTGVWGGATADDSTLYTQNPTFTDSTQKVSFDTGSTGAVNLVNADSFQIKHLAANLVAFMRGFDVKDEDGDGVYWESRRWLMNDPLHSRPRPINYGARGSYSATNPDIRILMGSNDGYFRMIRNTKSDGTESGEEVWAFMPRAVMKIQKQLMNNAAGGTPIHPIGLDGPPADYIYDANGDGTIISTPHDPFPNNGITESDSDKVWVFFGLRRGGKGYYGLNISDPDNPSLLWRINSDNSDFSELGLTFSQPAVRMLKWGSNPKAKPVLIFGGGYDPNKDYRPTTETVGTNDTMGNAVYVVDAETGVLIWKAVGTGTHDSYDAAGKAYSNKYLTDSIPSEVTTQDYTNDGSIDRFYVGDTGGQVWRADLVGTDVSKWKITRILNVGRHATSTSATATEKLANDRRFFYAPDVVRTRDSSGEYVGVLIASGNREHPLQISTVDWVYMYKDRIGATFLNSSLTPLDQESVGNSLQDVTDNCVQEVSVACGSGFSLEKGWRLKLEDQGEKSLSPPLIVRGVVYFNTYLPSTSSTATSCGPKEGKGFYYEVALNDARAVTNYDSTNTVYDANGNIVTELQKTDRKVQLTSDGIPAESVYVCFDGYCGILRPDLKSGQDIGKGRWRTFWYEKQK